MPTKYERCMCKMIKTTENENVISADKLIETFTDMADRGTLLCGRNVTQEDFFDTDHRYYCKSFNGFVNE